MTRSRNKKRKRATSPPREPDQTAETSGADVSTTKPKRFFDQRWKTATTSPQDVLKGQMDLWRSLVYGHFKLPPEIVWEDGVWKYRFYCLKHPLEFITRARTDPSTSNLNSHVEVCDPEVAEGQSSIASFAHGSSYNKAEFRYLTTVWVTTCFRPFAIIEDEPLQEMFKMLYAPVEMPSASTVSRDVKEVFVISKGAVAEYLQRQKGAIHIAFDGWTAPNVLSFLGVVVCFEQSGELISFLLDFVRLRKGHSGEYLAEKLHECLESYGISDKIFGQTADNAANNDTMIRALGHRLSGPAGPHTQIRCMCHVLNLCVKGIMQPFVKKKKKKTRTPQVESEPESDSDDSESEDEGSDEEDGSEDGEDNQEGGDEEQDDDDEELDLNREASDEAELAGLAHEAEPLGDEEQLFAQKTISKVHNLTKKIFHSPTLRDDLEELCTKHNLKPLGVVRSVPTRWNSIAMTSKRTIYLRPALQELVSKASHNKSRGPRLLRFKLSDEEWTLLIQLQGLLADFLEATERMSVRARPLLHEVICVMDALEAMLTEAHENPELLPAVRAAASLGRAVLNKYYAKTDDSIMYRCAILLHPRHKTAYFQRQKWPQSWIDTAVNLLRNEWKRYKPAPVANAGAAQPSQTSNTFAALDAFRYHSGDTDALEDYLISPPLPSVSDPIKHWHSLDSEQNPLARMALDMLSAPATSVDAERSFSRGALTVSKLRRNLSDQSTRAATVLSAWMKIPGLVPKGKVVMTMTEKSSRAPKTAAGGSGAGDPIVVDE